MIRFPWSHCPAFLIQLIKTNLKEKIGEDASLGVISLFKSECICLFVFSFFELGSSSEKPLAIYCHSCIV